MSQLDARIAAIRRFSRYYTARIGALREGLHESPHSLAEARVIWELANRDGLAASDVAKELGLDPGYLSRILRRLERDGIVTKAPSPTDRRQSLLALTEAGRAAFAVLDRGSKAEIAALLEPLDDAAQRRLVGALDAARHLLGDREPAREPYILRPPLPGDIGIVVSRHGALYAEEYGWDTTFEGLVAKVAGAFLESHDPARERCWIAERDGAQVGSVFVVRAAPDLAKLRLLYVEPQARGLGIGRRLVAEAMGFAKAVGYRRMTLWTNSCLLAARGIYVAAGFEMTHSEPHHSFGHDLVAETWERDL